MMGRSSVKWLYELPVDFRWQSRLSFEEDSAFEDKQGVRRLEVRQNGEITVLAGYAWDGCTPKVCVLDLLIGVPDGVVDSRTKRPRTYYASLVHDVLYQFLSDGLCIRRKDADRCFLRLMTETKFLWRYPYYWAVRVFGGVFRWLGKVKRKTRGRKVPL
jgi:hypothetical protein